MFITIMYTDEQKAGEISMQSEEKGHIGVLSDGSHATDLSYVTIYCTRTDKMEMPNTNHMYLYLMLEGSLRLYTPAGILDYECGQYSVSAIDTPETGYVLAKSERERLVAVSVEFNPSDVISILLELEQELIEKITRRQIPESVMDTADRQVEAGVLRLLEIAENPIGHAFLGSNIRREILFHVLCGKSGAAFLESTLRLQNSADIYETNTWIKQNYKQTFTTQELAKKCNMSVSAFHEKFRSAVGMAPLQCQKRLRLTEARRLMLDADKNVSEAASSVGYDNFSQFIREYRKLFGLSPKDDIRRIKALSEK